MNAKDEVAKVVTGVHRMVFRATKGKVLGSFGGMPAVELTTTGRKTGKKRATMLTAPIAEDERVVLVASWGGDDRHPTWYLNLRDHPEVELTAKGTHRLMRARTASAEEKAELWPGIVGEFKGYAGYQEKTDRDIPVVILEPR
ncbi:MAG: nitroreductase/quinone reductase family protein [Acidimicrobiales bacterium]